MEHLTNFSFEFFYEIFTEDASQRLLYHGAKKSKMTKNSNQGDPALIKGYSAVTEQKGGVREQYRLIYLKTEKRPIFSIVLGEKNLAPSKVGQTENFQTEWNLPCFL